MQIAGKLLVQWPAAVAALLWMGGFSMPGRAETVDLRQAVVLSRPGPLPNAEKMASVVLVEEIAKRTGIRLTASTRWPAGKTVIAITSEKSVPGWGHPVPERSGADLVETHPEGYRLLVDSHAAPPVVWIIGADARGTLFGAGNLLRRVDWAKGELAIDASLDIHTAPQYAIRGHQLGYRPQANSYDAWSPAQFEQYIRELTFFGVNSIEGIPFQDERTTPVMKTPRREMNRAIGEICQRYGLDYWVWVPADFSLNDKAKRAHLLAECDQFFHDTPELTAVSFPGGDPGNNSPELVMPFLEDMSKLLKQTHPKAKIWMSVQQYKPTATDFVFNYIREKSPDWLGGLVAGPSSPPLDVMRERLPSRYELRDYPDLTHNKLSQYEVPDWDQAFALTLGREAVNPRPMEYAAIFGRTAGSTSGFISYSDGIHDDVNKTIWSALSWNPQEDVRDILNDYARVYFAPKVADRAVDAILALERNWHGPLAGNGAVEGTLLEWHALEKIAPELETNWRWQMCLLRANYDAYVQKRLLHEAKLEDEADRILRHSAKLGAEKAMTEASAVLDQVRTKPVAADVRTRIFALCDELFHSIGLQTSVPKYDAIGEERGAVLDFVDYPLNNRWWLEDQFKAVREMKSDKEKEARLYQLGAWAHPGPGSFYDDLGNLDSEPHVVHYSTGGGPEIGRVHGPTYWWWDKGFSRARLSWQVTMWPRAMVYDGLDPQATYVVRSSGYGQALLRIDGDRVEPSKDGREMGDVKEFPVDAKYLKDRKLVLTWDEPVGEENLNWRKQSRLAEVWLIKEK